MRTLAHIEDYLEVIVGRRDPVTNKPMNLSMWDSPKPLINLARYDVGFLESVTEVTTQGGAMTDRQAELAVKIVLKYQRQLHAHGVMLDPAQVPPFRKPYRVIDRSQSMWLEDNHILVKFPYDTNKIGTLRDFLKESQGGAKFVKDQKIWRMDLTEYMVNFLVTWGQSNDFDISQDLQEIQQAILEEEARPYKIELRRIASDKLEIANAESSLLEYIEQLGITLDNKHLVQLADLSNVLCYDVSPVLWYEIENLVPTDMVGFIRAREYQLTGDHSQLKRILSYAKLVNRLPVVVYDPNPKNSLQAYIDHWGEDQMTVIGNTKIDNIDVSRPALWSHKAVANGMRIPLLISHVGLIAGAEKQIMIQNTEKIIYFNRRLNP